MPSSWNWESAETVEYLYWASGEPNVVDNQCAFGYIINSDGRWRDFGCSEELGRWKDSNGYGYICKKTIPTTPQVTSTVLDASNDVTMHPGTTTNQLISLIPTITIANPPVISTLEEATDVTYQGTIDNDLTITDDIRMTDCCLVNEDESKFDLTAVVISSVTLNVVFAVVIVMLLHRFHDQLFCKSESDLKTSEKSQKPANVCHVIEENAAYGGFNEDVQQPVYVEVAE
ncbi:uncharacterized protein [Antedon mediterranea]|uniref:uncharacterized protein n=1 Tax=Antedon mediterranea TaxID=105859 RepID=UPI003AF97781